MALEINVLQIYTIMYGLKLWTVFVHLQEGHSGVYYQSCTAGLNESINDDKNDDLHTSTRVLLARFMNC